MIQGIRHFFHERIESVTNLKASDLNFLGLLRFKAFKHFLN